MRPHSHPPIDPSNGRPNPVPAVYEALHFLDSKTCRNLRTAMDCGIAEPAEVLDQRIALDLAARRATNIEIDAASLRQIETRLDAVRQKVAASYRLSLVTREGASLLRYSPGDFYGPHRDQAIDTGWADAARRLISVVIFLNSSCDRPLDEEFSGGELIIYPEPPGAVAARQPVQVVPRQGSLVAFDAALLHEVRPVRAGVRDVIVDWFYGPADAGPYQP